MNTEKMLSVLALEIERELHYEFEIRRRSNVDILSSMLLSNYEIARLSQNVLDEFASNPEEIPQRVAQGLAKWYTLKKRSIDKAPSIIEVVERIILEESCGDNE